MQIFDPANPFAGCTSYDQRVLLWQETASEMKSAIARESAMRDALAKETFPDAGIGTSNYDLGKGYILKAKFDEAYTLDNKEGAKVTNAMCDALEQATKDTDQTLCERLVKWEPKISVGEYKKLKPEIKKLVDESGALTIKPSKVSLEIVKPKND